MTYQQTEKGTFMEPMTDEQVELYADTVLREMDSDKVISGTGMEFITRDDNIPNEEDQEKIMAMIEEKYNAQSEDDEGTGDSIPDGKEAEPASEEVEEVSTTEEAEAPDEVAEVEAVVD
jgi:hypothetical protein